MTVLLACAALVTVPASIHARPQGREPARGLRRTAGGYDVYLGIVSAGVLFAFRPDHGDLRMHGGMPAGLDQHHLLVGLFDTAGGGRIGDAEISARVTSPEERVQEKRLKPFSVENSVSYGNFFALRQERSYRIDLTIRRPGAQSAVEVAFDYKHRL